MPLPEAPRKRGTILDASAYGKKTDVSGTEPIVKPVSRKSATKSQTKVPAVKGTRRVADKTSPKPAVQKTAKSSKTVKKTPSTLAATASEPTAVFFYFIIFISSYFLKFFSHCILVIFI